MGQANRVTISCLIAVIKSYRYLASAFLGPCCRFEPSCSGYAIDAMTHHGVLKGSYLTVKRLLRCHPFHAGGHDPVPIRFHDLTQT